MAGILANSVSATMSAGDTSANNTVSGYAPAEKILLSVTPSGSTYAWDIASPSGATVRSALTRDDEAASSFVPEMGGSYLVTCTVDGTTIYTIRIGVVAASSSNTVQVLHLQPIKNASVATPGSGALALYNSYEVGGLAVKDDTGTVTAV